MPVHSVQEVQAQVAKDPTALLVLVSRGDSRLSVALEQE